jgi:hypothetical protein
MKTSIVIPSIAALLALLTFTASGQSPETKIEVGAQSTSLTLFHPDFFGDLTQPGFGGRVIYNFTRVSMPIFRRPPETRHNFQFNAGIGFRF